MNGKPKPNGLRETTALLVVENLLGFTFFDWANISTFMFVFNAVAVCLLIGLTFVVIWHYWRGRNWARWVVLAISVLGFYNLTMFPSSSAYMRVVLILEAALSAFLLYWLNTRNVSAYFKSN